MIRLLKYLGLALAAMALILLAAAVAMNLGVTQLDLDHFRVGIQPVLDVFRLLHVVGWVALFVLWPKAIAKAAAKGWIKPEQQGEWLALKGKIMAALAAYIVLVVIGTGRIFDLFI